MVTLMRSMSGLVDNGVISIISKDKNKESYRVVPEGSNADSLENFINFVDDRIF